MDWDVLRYVLAITREGGLSGAARVLGVTHSTVSRQLARAEAAAGVTLFTRLSSGLQPTDAGQEAAARAAAIEAEVIALDMSLSGRDERVDGPLVLSVPPLIMQSGLAGDICAWHAVHPGVTLTIHGSDRIADLHRREADVVIRVTRSPSESLWGRKLTDQRAGWFASPDFLRNHVAELATGTAPIVSFTGWQSTVPQELPRARIAARLDDMVAAVALARAGMAMVRMPVCLGQGDVRLIPVPGLASIDYWPIWALTHPDLRRNPRVRGFIGFLGERFAARREAYLGQ